MIDKDKIIGEINESLSWCSEDDNPNGGVIVKIWVLRDILKFMTDYEKEIRWLAKLADEEYSRGYSDGYNEKTIEIEEEL